MSHSIDAPGSSTFGISGSGTDNRLVLWNGTDAIDASDFKELPNAIYSTTTAGTFGADNGTERITCDASGNRTSIISNNTEHFDVNGGLGLVRIRGDADLWHYAADGNYVQIDVLEGMGGNPLQHWTNATGDIMVYTSAHSATSTILMTDGTGVTGEAVDSVLTQSGSQIIVPTGGTSGAPALGFGDGDSGIYESSDDVIRFIGNGSVGDGIVEISDGVINLYGDGVLTAKVDNSQLRMLNTMDLRFDSATSNVIITGDNISGGAKTQDLSNASGDICVATSHTAGKLCEHGTTAGEIVNVIAETTGVASASYASVGGTNVNSDDTFGGYSVGQIVTALQNVGILT